MVFPLVLTAVAWLVPNHYAPWSSAWGDAVAFVGLLILLLVLAASSIFGGRVSWRLSGVAALCYAVMLAQLATGKLLFAGDALMVALYVGVWLAAVLAGGLMVTSENHNEGLNTLTGVWFFAALLSVGIALVQWTGALSLGVYVADLPPGARPFANVGQPNHLCTLCFLGLCGLLWLHQGQRVNGAAFWSGASFLLWGMVMSQSRTGWLQIGLLLVWGLAMRTRASLRITRMQLVMLGVLFATGVVLWPMVCDVLLLSSGRTLDDQMQAGARLPYWWSMVDAIAREPLWGYGWQQVGAAQQRIALDHPSVSAMFEHSHNLALDFLLWNGIPIGSLIITVLVWWLIAHIRACYDARAAWLLAAVSGVFVHAMLEFPLEYAYFLVPVGLAMGSVEATSPVVRRWLRLPRWALLSFTLLLSLAFGGVVVDYLKAENNYRTLRMESARIGSEGILTPPANLYLLTQLGAFLQFIHTEATPGMRPDQVDWMRKVSERFGYPSVLFRYALAAGLNGQPEIARETLARLCRIHEPQRCVEAREGWAALQVRYPQLVGVSVPK